METLKGQIEDLIKNGSARQALSLLDGIDALDKNPDLLYLKGSVLMKLSDMGGAMSCFRKSEALNPQGKAGETSKMLEDIMNFYNKDLYNP